MTEAPVCIVGMHRSGTSMVARLLKLCGLNLGADSDLMPGVADDNPSGYWEHLGLTDLNQEILVALGGSWDRPPKLEANWWKRDTLDAFRERAAELIAGFDRGTIWGWKDPRNCFTLPFWLDLLPRVQTMLCLRHPLEVVPSLSRGGEVRSVSSGEALRLWAAYHEQLLNTVSLSDLTVVSHYSTYFYSARAELERVLGALSIRVDDETIREATATIESGLRHTTYASRTIPPTLAPAKITRLYAQLCEQAGPVYHEMVADESHQASQLEVSVQSNFAQLVIRADRLIRAKEEAKMLKGARDELSALAERLEGEKAELQARVDRLEAGATASTKGQAKPSLVPRWDGDWSAIVPRVAAERGRVLVIDRWAPTVDQDSGSYRMSKIMACLLRGGMRVTFIGAEPAEDGRYEEALSKAGIEVVVGRRAAFEHLREFGATYESAIVSRPQIARAYLGMVRALATHARVLYDTGGLRWVRLLRRAQVSEDPREYEELAAHEKALELSVARAADVTLAITEDERRVLLREALTLRVEVLPNIHEIVENVPGLEGRRGLFFIGGFGYRPNVDAVTYFVAEILPRVVDRIPDIRFTIVGSRTPAEIESLASPNIEVLGFVRDVAPVFDRSRVFVAPLRVGAGMKGKVGQSLSHGLPVVSTTVGAEGLGLIDGTSAMISDDPAEFADRIVELHEDPELWARISGAGKVVIESLCSEEVVTAHLTELLRSARAVNG